MLHLFDEHFHLLGLLLVIQKNPNAKYYRGAMPYLDYLTDAYYVIRSFIETLWGEDKGRNTFEKDNTLLEHDVYIQWREDIATNGFPGLELFDPIDVITTIIWTSSTVHCSDHVTYGNLYENWPMYSSPVDFNINGTWQQVLNNQSAAFRSHTFIDLFCNYRYSAFKAITEDMLTSPHLYSNWSCIPQKWKLPQLREAHKQFLNDLNELNLKWGWLMDIKAVAASTCF